MAWKFHSFRNRLMLKYLSSLNGSYFIWCVSIRIALFAYHSNSIYRKVILLENKRKTRRRKTSSMKFMILYHFVSLVNIFLCSLCEDEQFQSYFRSKQKGQSQTMLCTVLMSCFLNKLTAIGLREFWMNARAFDSFECSFLKAFEKIGESFLELLLQA